MEFNTFQRNTLLSIPYKRYSFLLLLLASLIMLSVFHPYPYDNVVTRWALTRQLVEEQSVSIDPYQHLTNDKALSGGHYFCDKAVFTSLIAALPHGVMTFIVEITGLKIEPSIYRYFSERLVISLTFILLLIMLMRTLQKSGNLIFLPLLALGAGSILFPYSTLLYGHVPAAFLLFLSYYCQNRERYLQADIFGALAAATEFPVMLPFLILVIYRGREYWNISRIFRLSGFIVLAFLPQFAHNWIAFSNPFTMGYSLESTSAFEGMKQGLFGFTAPSLKTLYLLLLSPERGLFFYMPWAALGVAGFFIGKRFTSVLKTNPLPLIVVSYILLFSAYYMPTGGWAFGPRHLIPIIPFFAIGLAKFVSLNRKHLFMAVVLVLPSILIALIGTFGEIHQSVHPVDNPVPLPQWNIGLTMMLDGHHSLWLFGFAGTLAASIALLILWGTVLKRSQFTWKGIVSILLWFLLIIPACFQNWSGKIDYYRGVLAEHRQEWTLAAEYYEAAAEDPDAPPVVFEKAVYCRSRIQ